MNILVTGGAGYLGSTLVRLLLERGNRVRVVDSMLHGGESLLAVWDYPAFEFVPGDLRDRQLMRTVLENMDSVVHLAAIVGDPACARNADEAREINLEASLNLLKECCRANMERFLFASTCSNYGRMLESEEYVDEGSRLKPLSVYAETKVEFEKVVLDMAGVEPMSATVLRFATLYGVSSRMRFDLTVNEFTLDMLTKRRLVVFGEQFWRPYVHVRDAARAVCEMLVSPAEEVRGQVYNVGATNQNFRKREIVDLIRVHAPDARIEYVKRTEDPRDYRVSFEKIAREVGFRITRTVEDGVAEVARLVRSNVIRSYADRKFRN